MRLSLSVDCLFFSESRLECRISKCRIQPLYHWYNGPNSRISIQSTIVPVISLLVQWLDSAKRNSAFQSRFGGVHRHFGARGMSSVRYGTRLGDLKNKQPTERGIELGSVTLKINNQQREP
jgi:hypothetical protein